jgi:hypothetical protein
MSAEKWSFGKKAAVYATSFFTLASFGGAAAGCGAEKQVSPDDGYKTRSVLHSVVNPMNSDKYTTFELRDRTTQDIIGNIDFHHLKSSPQKFERLIAGLGLSETLKMSQENNPLGISLEFQHSLITLTDPITNKDTTLQINRVKPTSEYAPEVTAYSLFSGKDNPQHLGTILLSDRQKQEDGERGEVFVALKPGTFDFEGTSERYAHEYIQKADALLEELKANNFNDPRIDQAVWKTKETNDYTKMNGVLNGVPYSIVIDKTGEEIPGYLHDWDGKNFKSCQILDEKGNLIAKITADHYLGVTNSSGLGTFDSIVFKFIKVENGQEKIVLENKRYYEDKSEFQTSNGIGTTVGFSATGGLMVGWTEIEFTTPVNYQDVDTFLYSYGPREANLSEEEIAVNRATVSAILTLLGGASIIGGLNFQDAELEWLQSTESITSAAKEGTLDPDMGFWSELPVDSTSKGQAEAFSLLTGK